MKITLLHYAAPPVVGGVESVLGHQARRMAHAGHSVQIVAGRGAQVEDQVAFIGMPRVDSQDPEVVLTQAELNAGRVPQGFSTLVGELAESLAGITDDSDWLIAHNVCSLNKNFALSAALRRNLDSGSGPRLALWHHDLAWTTPRYRDQLHDGYPWELLRQAWPGAVQVTVSEFRRAELATLFGIPDGQIRVIPNGLDASQFFKWEDLTNQFIERLGLLQTWPLMFAPVRITPRKNLQLALRVLAELKRDFPAAALLVTGPLGPHNPANRGYYSELLSLRRELGLDGAAHFLAEQTAEFLPDTVISDFYRLADLLFLPSREEGFGIPVLEAGFERSARILRRYSAAP